MAPNCLQGKFIFPWLCLEDLLFLAMINCPASLTKRKAFNINVPLFSLSGWISQETVYKMEICSQKFIGQYSLGQHLSNSISWGKKHQKIWGHMLKATTELGSQGWAEREVRLWFSLSRGLADPSHSGLWRLGDPLEMSQIDVKGPVFFCLYLLVMEAN